MRRDIALLETGEQQMLGILEVLRANLAAVKGGNLTFETNLLERFDTDSIRTNVPSATQLTR
jgi:hypothetical protein